MEVSQPATPTRRWSRIFDAFKPAGKKPRRSSPRFLHAILSTNHAGKVSIAIQNEDRDEDVIIVTTLSEIPFCCHADLLTMNREQLLIVAEALNAKLPTALQIDVQQTDACIRNNIELIVGLRQNAPDAPVKASHQRSLAPDRPVRNRYSPMSPMSPLAKRSRSQSSYTALLANASLGILEEEVEEIEFKTYRRKEGDEEMRPLAKRRKLDEITAPVTVLSDRRVTRSQSARVPAATRSASSCTRVLRSHSQKLPTGQDEQLTRNTKVVFKTSTPKRDCNISYTPSATIDGFSASTAASTSSGVMTQRVGRRKKPRALDNDMEMTFGIEGMTMMVHSSAYSSGIDFCMD